MRRRFISYQRLQESFDYNYYLTIEALEDGLTVIFNKEIEYGIDGVGWKKLRGGLKSPSINKGHTISFRAKLTPEYLSGIGTFTISNACNLIGNIMSLLFYNDAASATSLIGFDYAFCRLFSGCTTIKSVSSNFTPATMLCSGCYNSMFQGCTSLTTAPELPATTLVDNCYNAMFQGCTSLTTAPELPATTLKRACYIYMFYGCTNLNYIKMLATDISPTNCLTNWVMNVSPTGTFIKNKDATWDTTPGALDTRGVPAGWTVITEEEEGENPYAFSFNIEVEQGQSWTANAEQLVQINKMFAIVTKFIGMDGGEFNQDNAPQEFDLRINGVRSFIFYYSKVNNESDVVETFITLSDGDGVWFSNKSFPWNNPVTGSFTIYAA